MLHLLWILPASVVLWAMLTATAFNLRNRRALAACRAGAGPAPDLDRDLPEPLQRFVAAAGLAPSAGRRFSAIEQQGEMRMDQGQPWLPFRATQVSAVDRPEFVWVARFRMPGGVPLRAVDALGPDGGSLEARVFAAIPVARASDPATTAGQLLRYLSELAWCPRAVTTNPQLRFDELDRRTVRVRCTHVGIDAELDLEFSDDGDLIGARGLRQRSVAGSMVQTLWVGRFSEHRELGGVRIPIRGEAAWILDGERFVYWRGRVTALTTG